MLLQCYDLITLTINRLYKKVVELTLSARYFIVKVLLPAVTVTLFATEVLILGLDEFAFK